MTDLGTPGGQSSNAFGINEVGLIVGETLPQGGGLNHAFICESGTMQDLNVLIPPAGGRVLGEAQAAINLSGQIVGFGFLNGDRRAFLLDPVGGPIPPLSHWGALIFLALAGLRTYASSRAS